MKKNLQLALAGLQSALAGVVLSSALAVAAPTPGNAPPALSGPATPSAIASRAAQPDDPAISPAHDIALDPHPWRQAIRLWTMLAAPQATAAQQRELGLWLPAHVDPARPVVVLIPGLDCDKGNFAPLSDRLTQCGYQVAYFSYPNDQSIDQSAALLGRQLNALRSQFPGMPVDLLTHSMGGLIARDWIEGPRFQGGVTHLIMIAPPNHGSTWWRLHPLGEAVEQYHQWKSDPNWRSTWWITDGLGEAADDLRPDSYFLTQLNLRPRRAEVKYTIIAGNKPIQNRYESGAVSAAIDGVPNGVQSRWEFQLAADLLRGKVQSLETREGAGDGPVTLASARLKGVDDFVILPADHTSLYCPSDDAPPPTWKVVIDRLSH